MNLISSGQPDDALLDSWPGLYGGLPPFDRATPMSIEAAYRAAVVIQREEILAIAANPASPTFENTLAALEDSGRALRRVDCLYRVFSSTMSGAAMQPVDRRLASLAASLDDAIAHDDALFARIDAVHRARFESGFADDQVRLVEVVRNRLRRQGAGLPHAARERLAAINGRLATLTATFNQNLIAEQDEQAVFVDDVATLAGLRAADIAAAATAALAKGRPGQWAIPNIRQAVWPVLMHATCRPLREQVWRMWNERGDHRGPHDNKPVIAEILKLRGEKATLLGYPSFAHLATADRMAGSPEAAMGLLKDAWSRVLTVTRRQIADMQAIADAEGADYAIAPWDRQYYGEKSRQARYGLDSEALKPYLALDRVLDAMFWAAGRVHGIVFRELADVAVVHPDVRVFVLERGGEAMAVLYFDLFQRAGKMRGSWSSEYRTAESFRSRVLPIASVNSNIEKTADGRPPLLTWEVANVLFHELGHALHMVSNRTAYPSLGSLSVAWDFIELPSLLNERWFHDRELLQRFMRHRDTGEPIPMPLVDKVEQALRAERVFSLNLDYLGPAIVDLELHLMADGRAIDPVAEEDRVLAELGMPDAWDEVMRVTHCVHVFANAYAAGLYSYLWADVMAADAADAFAASRDGLYDGQTATRWQDTILSVGNSVPADEAFRRFLGRDPSIDALMRRFDLEDA